MGNLVRRTENAGASNVNERRVIEYAYDARGNQIQVTFPDAGRVDAATGTIVATGVRPKITTTYDAQGRAVVRRDTLGNYSYKVHDQAGRLAYEVDAAGYVTSYGYDPLGRQTSLRRHAQAINKTTLAGTGWVEGQAISLQQIQASGVVSNSSSDRLIYTDYNVLGRKTIVRQVADQYWTVNGTSASHQQRTELTYNAYGDLVRESVLLEGVHNDSSAVWARTYYHYDELGRRTLMVDPEGYVTAFAYNDLGEEILRIEFARPVSTTGLS